MSCGTPIPHIPECEQMRAAIAKAEGVQAAKEE